MNAWSESFLPDELQANLRGIRVPDGHGGTQPLVQDEQLLSPNRLAVPPAQAPDLRLPLGAAGLAFALLLAATARRMRLVHALLATLYLLVAGLVGLLLLVLWTLTSHHSAWANANLLLFSPLAFMLLRTVWSTRRGIAPSHYANAVLVLQLAAALVAVLLHLLPGTVQQNQPWLLFALPVWIALAWSLRQVRPAD
jgi:hypothetical protein